MKTAVVFLLGLVLAVSASPPNIIFVFFDDLGFHDVGYHGSEFLTPHIDNYAAEGVKLENYYVHNYCSPSRTTFFTGRLVIHTGVLTFPVFQGAEIGGVPLSETLMPQVLDRAGYDSHMIGKWHLGHSSLDYIPTGRGFKSFLGYYLGRTDSHFHHHTCLNGLCGYDLHDDVGRDPKPAFDLNGTYSTWAFRDRAIDLINNHDDSKPLFLDISFTAAAHCHTLEAPEQYYELYPDITDEKRMKLGASISAGDDAVHAIIEALKDKGMWDNTIFIFSADNGGHEPALNTPLRGHKGTYWEGGIRGAGFVNSPLLEVTGVEMHGLMHVSDWLPTFAALAGADTSDLELDGMDMWDAISGTAESPRSEICHNIDEGWEKVGENLYPDIFDIRTQASMRVGDWKLMTGKQDDSGDNLWLFNIKDDPDESNECSAENPDVVEELLGKLAEYQKSTVPQKHNAMDEEGADPQKHDGAWMPWQD